MKTNSTTRFVRSTGYFLISLGLLILGFILLKSFTFDSISGANSQSLSWENPFAKTFVAGIALVLVGCSLVMLVPDLVLKKLRSTNQC